MPPLTSILDMAVQCISRHAGNWATQSPFYSSGEAFQLSRWCWVKNSPDLSNLPISEFSVPNSAKVTILGPSLSNPFHLFLMFSLFNFSSETMTNPSWPGARFVLALTFFCNDVFSHPQATGVGNVTIESPLPTFGDTIQVHGGVILFFLESGCMLI